MTGPRFAYPMVLDLGGRRAVVVGGGGVALRKARALADAGASVRVVSPRFRPDFETDPRLERAAEPYDARHVAGAFVVVAATDDEAVNARVSADARAAGALVNVVDRPALCDFIVPAQVTRGPLVIAISTGGAAPSLARRLRERLQREVGPEYETLLTVLAEVRERLKQADLPAPERQRLFERLTEADLVAAARRGPEALRSAVEAILGEAGRPPPPSP